MKCWRWVLLLPADTSSLHLSSEPKTPATQKNTEHDKKTLGCFLSTSNPKQNLFALSVSERRTDAPGLSLAKHHFMHEDFSETFCLFFWGVMEGERSVVQKQTEWKMIEEAVEAELGWTNSCHRHYVIHKTSALFNSSLICSSVVQSVWRQQQKLISVCIKHPNLLPHEALLRLNNLMT